MAHLTGIGRPYARAAFEYAKEKKQLPSWQGFLASAANMAKIPEIMALLTRPDMPHAQLAAFFEEILAPSLEGQRHFLRLLAQNKRLAVLPVISSLFGEYLAALEKMSKVRLITAVETEEQFRKEIMSALSKRTKQEVSLQCQVEPAIIGGAIIHLGDQVIDGSIRGKLARLLEFSLR